MLPLASIFPSMNASPNKPMVDSAAQMGRGFAKSLPKDKPLQSTRK